MPWKVNWRVVGIAGLSLLMCGGCSAEAQSGAAGARPQGQAGQQALPPEEAAGLWDTVRALRTEVTQLRQEVARLRAQVADTGTGGSGTAGQQGTGGSGTAGAAQGTGGSGTAQGASDVPPTGSGVPAPQGTAVVNAVYTGVVSAVSEQRVVIRREDGTPLTLGTDAQTRVFRDGQRIAVRQLEKGEQVRAVVDLVDDDKTVEIAVQQPAAAPEE